MTIEPIAVLPLALIIFGLGMIVGGLVTERAFRHHGLYDGKPLNRWGDRTKHG